MSLPHHEQSDLVKRFIEQASGNAPRAFPNGRIGNDDDGEFIYAMATDFQYNVIRIRFSYPTEWIALDRASAEKLRDELTTRIMELRGIKD